MRPASGVSLEGVAAPASYSHIVRKAAGIAFLLYCGFTLVFLLAYLIGATQFDLPPGPPIVAVVSVALACVLVTRLARRQG